MQTQKNLSQKTTVLTLTNQKVVPGKFAISSTSVKNVTPLTTASINVLKSSLDSNCKVNEKSLNVSDTFVSSRYTLDFYNQRSEKFLFEIFENLKKLKIEDFEAVGRYSCQNFNSLDLKKLVLEFEKSIKNAEHERDESEEVKFNFSNWKGLFFNEKLVKIEPRVEFFEPIDVKDIGKVINFHFTLLNDNSSQEMLEGKIKIPTPQNRNVIEFLISQTRRHWHQMSSHLRLMVWILLVGFNDNVKPENIKFNVSQVTKEPVFIQTELKEKRILKVENFPWGGGFLACKYFSINEEKQYPSGEKYIKTRFVSNMVIANNQMGNDILAEELEYNFQSADLIFKDKNLFTALMKAVSFSVLDKKDYYRQLKTIPSPTAAIITEKEKFIDLRLKQGHRFSSCVAQGASNLQDFLFERNFTLAKQVSLQDDSFIINMSKNWLPSLDRLKNFNQKFGFLTNEKKTQYNCTKVTWSGYDFDCHKKSLSIPNEKSEKFRLLGKEIMNNKRNSRRLYAKFLGKLYAYRLIAAGLRINFSIISYRIRRLMFKDSSYFYEKLQNLLFFKPEIQQEYKDFFDEKIDHDKRVDPEIYFAIDIIKRVVPFRAVRKYVFSLNALLEPKIGKDLQNLNGHKFINRIYCDASDNGVGICAQLNGKSYGFSIKLERKSEIYSLSINVKELYGVFIAMIFARYLDREIGKVDSDWIIYIDNEAAKSVSISQKPNLRAQNLIDLTLCISRLQMFFQKDNKSSFYFQRISSGDNILADFLSRDFSTVNKNNFAILGDIFRFERLRQFITDDNLLF